MGLGSIVKKIGGIVGAVAGVATGNPALAIGSLGSLVGGGAQKTGGTAADPSQYVNIRIPGFNYPNANTPLVDMPVYPESLGREALPLYRNAPTVDASMMPASQGELMAGSALGSASSALRALLDPYSPEAQKMAAEEEQLYREDYSRSLRDLMTANRRSRSMGRGSLFDPERGGEVIMDAVTRSAMEGKAVGRQNATARLQKAYEGYNNLATGYRNVGNMESARRDAYRQDMLNLVNQKRQDYATLNSQMRSGVQRRDDIARERIDQRRQDILNALDIYRGNTGKLQGAQAEQRSRSAGEDAALMQSAYPVATRIAGSIYQGSLNPWMNPDSGSYF